MLNKDKRFDIDLAYGNIFEQKLLDMFKHSKVEVKTERDFWAKSGNIAIEHSSRNKPSGIMTTEADYWFHNLARGDELLATIVLPTDTLRTYIGKAQPRTVSGGDNGTSSLYLINIERLFKELYAV
jgi:hypothetical protein